MQSVKVEVEHSSTVHLILIHERESRAGHIFANANTATHGLNERSLTGAEVAFEGHKHGGPKVPPELLTPRVKLVKREARIVDRGNWESGIGNRRVRTRWSVACGLGPGVHLDARI